MPICINQKGDIFEEIIDLPEDRIDHVTLNHPITHALVVANSN